MVLGVLGEPLLEGRDVVRRLGGQGQGGANAVELGVLGAFGSHFHHFAGALGVAACQVAAGQAGDGLEVLGIQLQRLGEGLGRAAEVAELHGLRRHGQELVQIGGRGRAGEAIDESLDLAVGQGAHEAVHRLAVDEGVDGGDRLHLQLGGDARVLVDVDLDQPDRALGGGDRLLQRRAELLAGSAPRRPEVDDHRRGARRLDDVGHEAGVGRILDQVGGAGGGGGFAQHGTSSAVVVFCQMAVAINGRIGRGSQSPQAAAASKSTTRASTPTAARKAIMPSREIAVVAVLTSGWKFTVSCANRALSSTTFTR